MSGIVADLRWLAESIQQTDGGKYREYLIVMDAIAEIERLHKENSHGQISQAAGSPRQGETQGES